MASLLDLFVSVGVNDNATSKLSELGKAGVSAGKGIADGAKNGGGMLEKLGMQGSNAGSSIAKAFAGAGVAIAGAFTVKKLAEFGAQCIQTAADAETSFAKVRTLLGSDTDTGAYFEKIKQASKETGVAIGDYSEAVYSAISASVEQGHAVEFTQEAVKLAKGGFTDTATAVDVLTTAINAYGLKATDATSISDKLITTQNLGKTTVGELATAMGRVIPTAKSFSVNIDALCGSYAVLTKNGIATAESTTYLNGMLNELGKDGTAAAKTLQEETGMSFSELMESGYSLGDALEVLQKAAKKTGKTVGDMFGSQEAGKAANTLAANLEDLAASTDAMRDSAGATEKAYATMSDTVSERVTRVKNDFELVKESVGEDLMPAFEEFLGGVEKLMPSIEKIAGVVVPLIGGTLKAGAFVFGALAEGIGNVVAPSNDAAKAMVGNAESIDDARGTVERLTAELAALEAKQKSGAKTYAETAGAATTAASSYAAAQSNVGNAADETAVKITNTRKALELAHQQLESFEQDQQSAAESAADPANRFQEATEAYTASSEQLMATYLETYEKTLGSVQSWFGPFEKASTNISTSFDQIKSNMQSQIDFNNQYAENLQYLADNGLGSLSESLQAYGKDGAAYAATIAEALEAAGGATSEKGQEIVQQFQELMAGVEESQGTLAKGFTNMNGQFAEQMQQITDDYAQAIEGLNKSEDALAAANATMSSFLSGINSGNAKAVSAMSRLGASMTSSLQASLGPVTMTVNVEFAGAAAPTQRHTSGSHSGQVGRFATGLDYVPYNEYAASLHRGEAVLNAYEADQWRRGRSGENRGTTINQYIQSVPQTPVQLAEATAAYFAQARWM